MRFVSQPTRSEISSCASGKHVIGHAGEHKAIRVFWVPDGDGEEEEGVGGRQTNGPLETTRHVACGVFSTCGGPSASVVLV